MQGNAIGQARGRNYTIIIHRGETFGNVNTPIHNSHQGIL